MDGSSVPAVGRADVPDVTPGAAADVLQGHRVLIFDTTLRDGEQSPGATLTSLPSGSSILTI